MPGFKAGLIWTAAPILLLSMASLLGARTGAFYWLWFLSALLWVAGIPVGLGLLVAGRRGLAGGVLAGVAVGAVALAGTFLVNVNTVDNL